MSKTMTKAPLIEAVVKKIGNGVSKREVVAVVQAITDVAYKELKKTGAFTLPGFAKFVVTKRAAAPERDGINPFTKQPIKISAKPASKRVRARAVKAIKDAVN